MFFATPDMRTVARMEFPSTSDAITCTLFSVVSVFIVTIILSTMHLSSIIVSYAVFLYQKILDFLTTRTMGFSRFLVA